MRARRRDTEAPTETEQRRRASRDNDSERTHRAPPGTPDAPRPRPRPDAPSRADLRARDVVLTRHQRDAIKDVRDRCEVEPILVYVRVTPQLVQRAVTKLPVSAEDVLAAWGKAARTNDADYEGEMKDVYACLFGALEGHPPAGSHRELFARVMDFVQISRPAQRDRGAERNWDAYAAQERRCDRALAELRQMPSAIVRDVFDDAVRSIEEGPYRQSEHARAELTELTYSLRQAPTPQRAAVTASLLATTIVCARTKDQHEIVAELEGLPAQVHAAIRVDAAALVRETWRLHTGHAARFRALRTATVCARVRNAIEASAASQQNEYAAVVAYFEASALPAPSVFRNAPPECIDRLARALGETE